MSMMVEKDVDSQSFSNINNSMANTNLGFNIESEKLESEKLKSEKLEFETLESEKYLQEIDEISATVKTKSTAGAVIVENAFKFFGTRKKVVTALDGLCMRVEHGSIYGLLGPSGCGKTTLLGCLVNQLRLNDGKIFIFGFPPGTKEAAVPGGRVGYMPQELALYQEFTINETLNYFGRLHQLLKITTVERANFLVKFLDLPDPNRQINQLSGGQQRRVSLAAALLHEPELLILDEPTVGVDPLLRTSIWSHLLEVAKTSNTTIIITTHYIEEARQADKVGLMRKGRLLAEMSPKNIINYFGLNTLEDAFLKLCLEDMKLDDEDDQDLLNRNAMEKQGTNKVKSSQTKTTKKKNKTSPKVSRPVIRDSEDRSIYAQPWVSHSKSERYFSTGRCLALIEKNLIRIKRNIGFLLFSFLFPPIQTILFCVTVGGTPHDLPMSIVNLDNPIKGPKISDIYLQNLDPYVIKQIYYDDFDSGYSSVVKGKSWGLMFFNTTFSYGLITRRQKFDGTAHTYMDNTNQQIALTLKVYLYKGIDDAVMQSNLIDNVTVNLPLKFEEPVYGIDDTSFRTFVAPGVLLTIIFFMAVGLTSLSFILERKEGLLERSWVSGVQPAEVMLSHLATQMLVMLVQITTILVFMFPVFQIPCKGNIIWVILLSILQGICGMTFGLMVSVSSKDELNAMQLILGTFYPILLISGIVWPVEAMPTFLKYISYILPQTYACQGIRAVLYRAWGITHFEVYIGYIITILWSAFFTFISVVVIRAKK